MILGLIPIIIIVITFANFTTSKDVVSNEDIEINILNMEEYGGNYFLYYSRNSK